MAAGRRSGGLQAVERLLKQGKVQAALGKLQDVADPSAQDPFTLNRLGDLLARQGRRVEAIDAYTKIAGRFADGGFTPKAIAIYKKILRLDPEHLESTVRLGELYLRENLRGEGRDHLLHAANRCVERGEFEQARSILERLVAADPKDFKNRIRLAETRAAAGEQTEAGEELLALGRELLDTEQTDEAEQLYRRASELLPDSHLPTLGLARCLTRCGKSAEALELLEQAVDGPKASPAVLAELALCYGQAERPDAALELLAGAPLLEVPHSVWRATFADFVARGRTEEIWNRVGPALDGDLEITGLTAMLESLSEIEEHGHVPALQRLLAVRKKAADREGTLRTLHALTAAYEARSMADEASLMREELARLGSNGKTHAPAAAVRAPRRSVAPDPARPPAAPAPAAAGQTELAEEVEAPAVPLNRADEEFVAGRLTQAEVLEKYGLGPQALDQLEEVATRYPGHVGAQENRVKLLRKLDRPESLAAALVDLAVARRAEGDASGAAEAASEAGEGALAEELRRKLIELGLLPGEPETEAAAVAAPAPPSPPPSKATVAPATPPSEAVEEPDGEVDLVIDFDDAEKDTPAAADDRLAEPVAAPPRPSVSPAAAPAEPSAPAPSVAKESGADSGAVEATSTSEPAGSPSLELGDQDLLAIAEALESELLAPEADGAVSNAEETEEAFEDVLSSFKDRVAEVVSDDDHRTHYDLAIGYKQMGLIDEAIQEFEVAVASAELQRDASTMIAICHRERDQLADAAVWYRKALASPGEADESRCELHYDLAETLLQAGDDAAALAEFRDLEKESPSYRDVADRIAELEAGVDG